MFDDITGVPALKNFDWGTQYREFTTGDDGTSVAGGLIEYARGGFDLNGDGIQDNYYPETYYIRGSPTVSMFSQMILKWRSVEDLKYNFSVQVDNVPDGWTVWALDNHFWVSLTLFIIAFYL